MNNNFSNEPVQGNRMNSMAQNTDLQNLTLLTDFADKTMTHINSNSNAKAYQTVIEESNKNMALTREFMKRKDLTPEQQFQGGMLLYHQQKEQNKTLQMARKERNSNIWAGIGIFATVAGLFWAISSNK